MILTLSEPVTSQQAYTDQRPEIPSPVLNKTCQLGFVFPQSLELLKLWAFHRLWFYKHRFVSPAKMLTRSLWWMYWLLAGSLLASSFSLCQGRKEFVRCPLSVTTRFCAHSGFQTKRQRTLLRTVWLPMPIFIFPTLWMKWHLNLSRIVSLRKHLCNILPWTIAFTLGLFPHKFSLITVVLNAVHLSGGTQLF